MRLPIILGLIGIAGLSVFATTYVLRPESNESEHFTSAHEQELQQEIQRLQKVAGELNASIKRVIRAVPGVRKPAAAVLSLLRN